MPLTGLPCLVSLRSWPDHFPASPPTENPFLDHGTDLSSSRWPGPGRNCFAGDRHIDRHPFSAVQRVASKHPGLRRDQARPISKGGDRAQVFTHVLLADQTHRNDPAIGIDEGLAEECFKHEYPLGMVPQRAVTGVCENSLRLVEPLDRKSTR